MSLAGRLMLAFVLVAMTSVAITGLLSYREAARRIPRALAEPGVLHGVATPRANPGGGAHASTEAGEVMGLGARGQTVFAEQLRGALITASALALLVAVLVGAIAALRLMQPIARLTSVTRRYGAGERSLRANMPGDDELAELGRIFDETADQLQAEQDVKQRFTTDVAHELRTPIAVLKSELEAIEDGLMEADADTVAGLREQVDLLARLVADLRTLTLAESEGLPLERARVNLGALAEAIVDAFQATAREGGVQLRCVTRPAEVLGDGDRLRQVTGNLLANALQHTPRGKRVLVTVHADAARDLVGITVHNQGSQIDPAHLEHVFDRFYRVDGARRRQDGGSGLGLAIVRALVEAHGGSVDATNDPEGGVAVSFHLPAAPPPT